MTGPGQPEEGTGSILGAPPRDVISEASFTCRLKPESIDLDRLRQMAAQVAWLRVDSDGDVRGSLIGDDRLPGFHGHFAAEGEETDGVKSILLNYSLHRNSVEGSPWVKREEDEGKESIGVSDMPDRLAPFLKKDDKSLTGVLSVTAELDRKDWAPTIPLPFAAAGALGKLPGSPQIAGLDFSFADTTQQPLVRAFISTYPEETIVRYLLGFAATFDSKLSAHLISETMRHLPLFVQRAQPHPEGAPKSV